MPVIVAFVEATAIVVIKVLDIVIAVEIVVVVVVEWLLLW